MAASPTISVLVDGRVIDHPTAGGRGVGRYSIGFVRALLAAGIEVTLLCSTVDQERLWKGDIDGCRTVPMERSSIRALAGQDSDTWFLCTQLMLHPVPLDPVPRMVTDAGLRVAAIMYDVIPQRYPERYLVDPAAAVQSRLRTVTARSIDLLFAISSFTRDTASVELGIGLERFSVVGSPIEPRFHPGPIDRSVLERFGVADAAEFVVSVTGADPRKNTERLIRAWSRLDAPVRSNRRLVIACAAPSSVLLHWNHIAHVEGVSDSVVLTGAVSDAEMVSLLRAATVSILPSTEEGFGLPIVESVNCGTPALCSNTSSMPEVSGSMLGLFNPFDVGDIAGALSAALTDPAMRSQLLAEQQATAAKWSIESVGEAAKGAFEGARRRWAEPSSVQRGDVVFLAPPDGSPSAIGGYTAEIRAAWPGDHVPVILDDLSCRPERHQHTGRAVVGVGSVGRRFRSHDAEHVVSVLGSSEYHAVTLDRAGRSPTHVWLHEPTVLGAVLGPALRAGGERWFRSRAATVGEGIPDGGDWSAEKLHAAGVTFLGRVATQAKSIIVPSQLAASLLQRSARTDMLPPVLVLPLAYPHRSVAGQHGDGHDRIVTLGWIEPDKRIDHLLYALSRTPDVDLDIIGGSMPSVREPLEELANDLGLAERVRFHGRVDGSELDSLLSRATLGVQLRRGDIGQMSGAIAELIARGVPVITDFGSYGRHGGVVIVDPDGSPESLAATIREVVGGRAELSSAAHSTAASWRPEDVAATLASWLDRWSDLGRGTLQVAGPW